MITRIIIDSSADVKPSLKSQFTIIPLTVHFGDIEYIDGVTINHKEFYKKLIESSELPRTSQATPDYFTQVFKEVVKKGEKAVVITLSSTLSGTYQSAVIAAQDYPDNIFVVDSKSAAIGSGILAELALQLAENGMDAENISKKLEEEKEKICIIATLNTLEYLKKGGRISKTVAFAGGLLSLKPIITLKDGEIQVIGKARGIKQAVTFMENEIISRGGINFSEPFLLGYTGQSPAFVEMFIENTTKLWQQKTDDVIYTCIGSVIGTHAGPDAFAVAFFEE